MLLEGMGNVQSKIKVLRTGTIRTVDGRKEGRRRTGMRIINDEQSEKIVGVTLGVRDHGSEHEIGCEIGRNVQKKECSMITTTGPVGC